MLVFTNRHATVAADQSAFGRGFDPAQDTLALATVSRSGAAWAVTDVQPGISDDAALQALVAVFGGGKPVLLYLHGNNNAPITCFERCARLEEIYGVAVIGFSWPSEGFLASGDDTPGLPAEGAEDIGDEDSLAKVKKSNNKEGWAQKKIRRYRQAKLNGQDSTDALARLLRLLSTARLYANANKLSVAAHSLGAHLLEYTLAEDGAMESVGAASNIVLIAPCTRAEGHAAWLGRLRPQGKVFVTYNEGDAVLFGAFIADGKQIKLGTEPIGKLVSPLVRYVSFSNAPVGFGGHSYFVAKAGDDVHKDAKKLFTRLFASEPDLQGSEVNNPRKVYPVNCDPDGSTCYMAKP